MNPQRMIGWALIATLAIAHASEAAFWDEVGDAGPLPGSAQLATGDLTALTSISGALDSTADRDMFRIYLTGGGTFSATTVGQPGTLVDTQLFLFDDSGRGIYGNDDDASGQGINQLRSTLPANHPLTPLAAGFYNLLIVASAAYPTSEGGVIFPNFTSPPPGSVDPTAIVGPTGPGGGSVITGYSTDANEFGTYRIALTGAVTVVPEPSSLAMLLIAAGPVGYGFARRETRRGSSARAA